ncbi:MAG: DUF378 domain-containing protein [Gammaproteobacteria bacterium]|nr:DUF378 domain-containing protein [Gammaproteobacteria bacterium]
MSKHLQILGWIAFILVIIGGLNWGLVGAFNFNLVTYLFGEATILTKVIYILVGISALYKIYHSFAKRMKTE